MLFNSTEFIFLFLPACFIGYWLVPIRFRSAWVVAASFAFYATAGIELVGLLTVLLAITYINARYLLNNQNQTLKHIGLVTTLLNLAPLLLFKYLNFTEFLALPLGISFYTFNLLGYGIDVYLGRISPTPSLIAFAEYITFFPALLSGPLIRYAAFQQQTQVRQFKWANVEIGVFTFAIGLAKKLLVANTMGMLADTLFKYYSGLGLVGGWTAALAFTYQIYFDFSGYSDMAVGIGYLLGFKLPHNFNAPYATSTITEFWQHWHITLSSWFRDYVYVPLSRNLLKRNKNQNPVIIRTFSLLVMMFLVGLWHGSNLTFILWGLYQGALLAIHARIRKVRPSRIFTYLSRALTFVLVVFGWVLFRSPSLQVAGSLYESMFGLHHINLKGFEALLNTLISSTPLWVVLLQFIILFIITNRPRDTWQLQPRQNWLYAAVVALLV